MFLTYSCHHCANVKVRNYRLDLILMEPGELRGFDGFSRGFFFLQVTIRDLVESLFMYQDWLTRSITDSRQ